MDPHFELPRLVAVYDAFDGDRPDLEVYAAIAAEFGARRVADIGCGTGVFAVLLAGHGITVTGVDPAAGSLAHARTRAGAERVEWLDGDATALPAEAFDLATMTGNVAQAIVEPAAWDATLRAAGTALRPGGRLVFETRDPARQGWLEWDREHSYQALEVDGVGLVEAWSELLDVALPLVTFRGTWVFAADGAVLTSDSTLRFRERAEVEDDLRRHGLVVDEVRDAPDRPGREFVFVARKPG